MDISETAQLGPFDQLNITNFIIRVPLLSIKLKTIFTHVTQLFTRSAWSHKCGGE